MAIHYNLPGIIFLIIWYGWSFPAIDSVQKNIHQKNRKLLTLIALFLGPIVWVYCILKSKIGPKISILYKKNLIAKIPVDFLDENFKSIDFFTKEDQVIKGATICGMALFNLISSGSFLISFQYRSDTISTSCRMANQWENMGTICKKNVLCFKTFLKENAGLTFEENIPSTSGCLNFSMDGKYFTITFHCLKNNTEERITGTIEQQTIETTPEQNIPQTAELITPPSPEELGLSKDMLDSFLLHTRAQAGISIIASPIGEGKNLLLQSICNEKFFSNTSVIFVSPEPIQLKDAGSIFVITENHPEKIPDLILNASLQMPDYLIVDELASTGIAAALLQALENNVKIITTIRADHALNALARLNSLELSFDTMGKFINAILCRRILKAPSGEIVPVHELLCPNDELKKIMIRQSCTLSQIVKFLSEQKLDNELYAAACQMAELGIITMNEAQKLDRKKMLLRQTF